MSKRSISQANLKVNNNGTKKPRITTGIKRKQADHDTGPNKRLKLTEQLMPKEDPVIEYKKKLKYSTFKLLEYNTFLGSNIVSKSEHTGNGSNIAKPASKFDVSRWKRKEFDHKTLYGKTLTFQQVETDYIVAPSIDFPEAGLDHITFIPIVRTFGVTDDGKNVCLYSSGFLPYTYIEANKRRLSPDDIDTLQKFLENKMRDAILKQSKKTAEVEDDHQVYYTSTKMSGYLNDKCIESIVIEYKTSGRDYRSKPSPFYKITLTLPYMVKILQGIVKASSCLSPWTEPPQIDYHKYIKTSCKNSKSIKGEFYKLHNLLYEDNILFEMRYMVDHGLVGTGWISIDIPNNDEYCSNDRKGVRFRTINSTNSNSTVDSIIEKRSKCQIELQCNHKHIEHHNIKEEPWSNKSAPMRIASFDIECDSLIKGQFPIPERDPVIQIAVILQDFNRTKLIDVEADQEGGESNVMVQQNDLGDSEQQNNTITKENHNEQSIEYANTPVEQRIDFYNMDIDQITRWSDLDPAIKRILQKRDKMLDSVSRNQGDSEYTKEQKVIFTVGRCAEMHNASVFSFDDERDMLLAFAEFIETSSPDIITGYNILNFDTYYLFKRVEALTTKNDSHQIKTSKEKPTTFADEFLHRISKVKKFRCWGKEEKFESSAHGSNLDWVFFTPGVVLWDMEKWVKREFKLRNYKLNTVSVEFLKEEKEDVHHSVISELQRGRDIDRRRLAYYCIKDSVLPLALINKLMTLVKEIENCRLSGIQFSTIMRRGQTIKVLRQVLGHSKNKGMLLPHEVKNQAKYIGADVLTPIKGFYDDYVITLDFASLYPSIMIAHNLCFSTYMSHEEAKRSLESGKLKEADITLTPAGHYFVKASVKKGVLPMILEYLLDQRSEVKKLLAQATSEIETTEKRINEIDKEIAHEHQILATAIEKTIIDEKLSHLEAQITDINVSLSKESIKAKISKLQAQKHELQLAKKALELKRKVLDARQNAIKISANSVYGFTGAISGAMYSIPVAESVTWYGRQMINLVATKVQEEYSTKNKRHIDVATKNTNLGYQEMRGKFDAKVLYGDTDSVMVLVPKKVVGPMENCMILGKEMAAFSSGWFKDFKPISMAFEKVYYPFFLFMKKNYAGVKWLNAEKPEKLEIKGIEAVKRDTTLFVADVTKKCLHKIMIDKKPYDALTYARNAIRDIRTQKVDIYKLIVTKKLNAIDNYKTPQAHAELAKRMMKRDPGTAPRIGERMSYVIIESQSKKLIDKAEDPLYVIQNRINIDANYYLQRKLINPLIKIFQRLYPNSEDLLTTGEHFHHIKNSVAMNDIGITKFLVKVNTKCVSCGKLLDKHDPIDKSKPKIEIQYEEEISQEEKHNTKSRRNENLCSTCNSNIDMVFGDLVCDYNANQARYSAIYKMCQSCRSDDGPVTCMEKTCEEFYIRMQYKRDLIESINRIETVSGCTW
jgi:DNA polymerase elongation subunit (family B)